MGLQLLAHGGRARGCSSGAGAWVACGRSERPQGRCGRQTGRALAAAAREGGKRAGRPAGRLRSARRERRAAGAGETGAGPAICPVDPRGRRDPGPRGPREAARFLCRAPGEGSPGGLRRGSEPRNRGGAGNPAPRADLGSFSPTCPHLCAAGRADKGYVENVGAAGFRRQKLFAEISGNKADILLSILNLMGELILFVLSISFPLSAGKADCSGGSLPARSPGCRTRAAWDLNPETLFH